MVIYHNKYENFHQMLFMIFALLFQIAFNKKLLSQKKKHSSRVSHQHGHKVLYLNEVTFGTDALHGYLCNSWCVNCLLFLCILKNVYRYTVCTQVTQFQRVQLEGAIMQFVLGPHVQQIYVSIQQKQSSHDGFTSQCQIIFILNLCIYSG